MPQKRKLAVSSTGNYQIFYYSSGYRAIDTEIYIYISCPIQTFTDSRYDFFFNRNSIRNAINAVLFHSSI